MVGPDEQRVFIVAHLFKRAGFLNMSRKSLQMLRIQGGVPCAQLLIFGTEDGIQSTAVLGFGGVH